MVAFDYLEKGLDAMSCAHRVNAMSSKLKFQLMLGIVVS